MISLGRVSGEIFFAVKSPENGQKWDVFKNKSYNIVKNSV